MPLPPPDVMIIPSRFSFFIMYSHFQMGRNDYTTTTMLLELGSKTSSTPDIVNDYRAKIRFIE
jgi:hypothetical protein